MVVILFTSELIVYSLKVITKKLNTINRLLNKSQHK